MREALLLLLLLETGRVLIFFFSAVAGTEVSLSMNQLHGG